MYQPPNPLNPPNQFGQPPSQPGQPYPYPPGYAAPPTRPFQQPPLVVYQRPPSNKNLLWLLLIPGVLIAVCVSCLGIGVLGSIISPSSTGTPTAGVSGIANAGPTPTSFDVSTLTDTTPAATQFAAPPAAVLGASSDAFTAAFGQPISVNDNLSTYNATINDIPTEIQAYTQTGSNGKQIVCCVSLGPQAGGFYNLNTAVAIGQTFAPRDAHAVTTVHTGDGSTEYVYQSATLAHAFPRADFIDDNNTLVPAGTFSITCTPNADGTTIKGCNVLLGRN